MNMWEEFYAYLIRNAVNKKLKGMINNFTPSPRWVREHSYRCDNYDKNKILPVSNKRM